MQRWRKTLARGWRILGAVFCGLALLVQLLAASDQRPTQTERIAREVELDSANSWRTGLPLALRVENGEARFHAPAHPKGSSLLLIVSSLARDGGPYPITIHAAPSAIIEKPILEKSPTTVVRRTLPAGTLPSIPPLAAGQPPLTRTFHLLVREGDVASGRNYAPLRARLRALGKRVQVYVAEEDLGLVDHEVLSDLVETFDERVFPTAARTFGLAEDVDGDGRFTIFLSSWLSRMGQGKQAVDGFIRVADLDPGYEPPFGNRCDMMYLSTELGTGPHLRTVVAHEYTHAVLYSRKTLAVGRNAENASRVEEEGWLDEAIAHLAEDLHGFSRSNLDYRVSAFLSSPERYRLVVDDYYAANLFRSHGNRGSTYLFLRWCAEQCGPALLPALIGSNKSGLSNLEAATGSSFASLYRGWSIALAANTLGRGTVDPEYFANGFRPLNVGGIVQGRCLTGPRFERLVAGQTELSWDTTGTSSRYLSIEGNGSKAVEVVVSGPRFAELQVTAIPLPSELPQLNLRAWQSFDSDGVLGVKLAIQGEGATPISLLDLSWGPLIPPAHPKSGLLPSGHLGEAEIVSRFGSATVGESKVLRDSGLKLDGVRRESGPYVLKLIGRDARGQTVTAWADINSDMKRPDLVENGLGQKGLTNQVLSSEIPD